MESKQLEITNAFQIFQSENSLLRKDFDLLRNLPPTVPMYADGCKLLVFRTFLQSVSVSKMFFFDTL